MSCELSAISQVVSQVCDWIRYVVVELTVTVSVCVCVCAALQTSSTAAAATQLRSTPAADVIPEPRHDYVTTHADLVRSRLRSSVMRSRSLSCRTDSIVVSLSKQLIQVSACLQWRISATSGHASRISAKANIRTT